MNIIKKFLIYTTVIISFFFISSIKVSAATPSNIYFLGDSRFVGMSKYDSNNINHLYHCEVGKGYSYLEKYISEIEHLVTEEDYIVINFGVNDLGNYEKYLVFINKISNELPCKIIYMTVNPVDELKEKSNGYNVTNIRINEFNDYLIENSNDNIYIVDANNYLSKNGFETVDGLHYTENSYKTILQYTNTYIENFDSE